MRIKGSITVFISFLMISILAFSSAICESIRFRGAKIGGICATDAAVESAISRYDIKLLEEFGIFGSYYEDKEEFLNQIAGDIEKNLYPEKEFFLLKDSDFWKLTADEISAKEYCLLTDNMGDAFYEQAVLYAKNNIATDVLELLIDYANNNEDPDSIETYFENEEQETDELIEQYEKEAEISDSEETYKYEGEIIEVEESPVDVVKQIRQSGILSLVIPGNEDISGNYVDLTACVSGRNLNSGTGKDTEDTQITEKAMYVQYLGSMLSDFNSSESLTKGLNYQLEYCIGGMNTDQANFKYVVNRLLLIKEATNFAYLMTDSAKKNQALAVAVGLVGATGISPLVEVVKYAILLAWAYAESILDVRNLLQGGSSSLVKTAENWRLGIENIGSIASIGTEPVQEKYGLNYNSYLKLLMMFQSKEELVMRGMDVIEMKMQQIYDNKDYCMDRLVASVEVTVYYSTDPVFLKFRMMKSYNYNSDFDVTTKYAYI